MTQKLDADLNIIAQSDIGIQVDPMTQDLNIIQALDDEPNDVGGLSAQQLKAKFDQAGNTIKTFINDSLIPQVLGDGMNEQSRQQNETARQANETARQTAESGRVSAESARQSAESSRVSTEASRVSAESQRQSAETGRANAETARVNAETARETAETARRTAETGRASSESARASAETARQSAETARQAAESGRASAETQRQTAETARDAAETARVSAEEEREAAETARQTDFDAAQTQRAETFTASQESRAAAFTASQTERAAAFTASQESQEAQFQAAEERRNLWEDYDPSKAYGPGNKVYYLGSSYVNTAACTNVLPTDTDHWQIIAMKGADGDGADGVLSFNGRSGQVLPQAGDYTAGMVGALSKAGGETDQFTLSVDNDGYTENTSVVIEPAKLTVSFNSGDIPHFIVADTDGVSFDGSLLVTENALNEQLAPMAEEIATKVSTDVFQTAMEDGPWLPLNGGDMIGPMTILTPTADANPATKGYVDTAIAAAITGAIEGAY